MKIAYFINDFPSYTQTFVLHQIVGMIERGHQVRIYARRRNELDTLPKSVLRYGLLEKTVFWDKAPNNRIARFVTLLRHILYLPKKSELLRILPTLNFLKLGKQALSLKLAYDAIPFLADGDFDIIHCQFGMLGPIAINLRQAGIVSGKVLTSFRGYDTDQYLRQNPDSYNDLFSQGDLFLPVQQQFGEWLHAKGVQKDKIRVLRSGIDFTKFTYVERCLAPGQPIRMISVARLVEKKGLTYAIEAVFHLVAEGYSVRYDIIGDGPLKQKISDFIQDLGLENYIFIRGWMRHEKALKEMQKAHILLAPSITAENGDQEGIPNVLKEAMALGLIVVSTWHSGIPELVEDGYNGNLVPEKDSRTLSSALKKQMESPENWKEFSRRGRLKVENNYNIQDLNDLLESIYKSA